MSYCQQCSTQIPRGQSYCYSHLGACQTCSTRIPSGQSYCASHANHKCQEKACSSQIPVAQPYCQNHINACQENNCSTRVPNAQKYCLAHKKQTLHKWWEEGKITEAERNKLSEFNLDNEYTLKQLKEILEEDAYINDSPIISNSVTGYIDPPTVIRDNLSNSLKRVRPKLALTVAMDGEPPQPPVEVTPFSTWFNDRCATIISGLNWSKLIDVWVAVCELPVKKIDGTLDIIWISEYPNKDVARNEAAVARNKLGGERPALYISPSLQVFYNNNNYLFVNVIKSDMPITTDPSEYLLPLDIIKRSSGGSEGSGGSYHHAAIYLGKDPKDRKHKVCHIFVPNPSASEVTTAISASDSASQKKKAKARIDDWNTFLTNNPKELVRYRVTIPFKKYEKEIEHIAKAVVTEYGKGDYHLVDRNCEHFAFIISSGINFSEQEQTNRDNWYRKFLYRRGNKIEKIDLKREMSKNDELFNNLVSSSNEEVVKKSGEIDQWSRDKNLFTTQQEWKTEVRVIIPPKYHNWK